MASCPPKDEGAHHMYPSDQSPYTVPYTGSAAVRVGSGHVASGMLVGPGVVRLRDDDIIDTSYDSGHDLAVATGAQINVPDHANIPPSCQIHQSRSKDTLITNDSSICAINALGIMDASATTVQSPPRKSRPTSTMKVKKGPRVHRDAANITDQEIRRRIDGLEGIVAEAKTTVFVDSVAQLEKCIREWQTILDVREKDEDTLTYAGFVEVDKMAPSIGMGHSVFGLANQIDEEKNAWGKFCSHQVKKALSLEAALPSGMRDSLRSLLEKTKIPQKAEGKLDRIAHDGNFDFDASADCEIVNHKDYEEPWEFV